MLGPLREGGSLGWQGPSRGAGTSRDPGVAGTPTRGSDPPQEGQGPPGTPGKCRDPVWLGPLREAGSLGWQGPPREARTLEWQSPWGGRDVEGSKDCQGGRDPRAGRAIRVGRDPWG